MHVGMGPKVKNGLANFMGLDFEIQLQIALFLQHHRHYFEH